MKKPDTKHFNLGPFEKVLVGLIRTILFLFVRPFLGTPFPVRLARQVFRIGAFFAPSIGEVKISQTKVGRVPVEIILSDQKSACHYIIYLHGGCFVSCSPTTHRAITTRLARKTNACVWVPDYRLAPENPYPLGLLDCVDCYKALLEKTKETSSEIVFAGDSAGASLALALCFFAKQNGLPLPKAVMVISPMIAIDENGIKFLHLNSLKKQIALSRRLFNYCDPVLRNGTFEMSSNAYSLTRKNYHNIFTQDISRFPPLLVQVGGYEMLLDDAQVLAETASAHGVKVKMEIYDGLWHVHQLFAAYIPTSEQALSRLAKFFHENVATKNQR